MVCISQYYEQRTMTSDLQHCHTVPVCAKTTKVAVTSDTKSKQSSITHYSGFVHKYTGGTVQAHSFGALSFRAKFNKSLMSELNCPGSVSMYDLHIRVCVCSSSAVLMLKLLTW